MTACNVCSRHALGFVINVPPTMTDYCSMDCMSHAMPYVLSRNPIPKAGPVQIKPTVELERMTRDQALEFTRLVLEQHQKDSRATIGLPSTDYVFEPDPEESAAIGVCVRYAKTGSVKELVAGVVETFRHEIDNLIPF